MEKVKLFALSGSLRSNSYNSLALFALQQVAPRNISIEIGSIGELPLFNPDLEETLPESVLDLKKSLSQSSGLILATPEYAHGVSGPMKNALDWLISGIEFPGMKIMLINTSPRASHALSSLKEILATMSGQVIDSAYVSLPLLGSDLNKDNICENSTVTAALIAGVLEFVEYIEA